MAQVGRPGQAFYSLVAGDSGSCAGPGRPRFRVYT